MKAIFGLFLGLVFTGSAHAVVLVQQSFASNSTVTDSHTGVTFSEVTASGVFIRSTGSTLETGGNGNGNAHNRWNLDDYISFTITAPAGTVLRLTSITLEVRSRGAAYPHAFLEISGPGLTGLTAMAPVAVLPTFQSVSSAFNMSPNSEVTVRFFAGRDAGNNQRISFDGISIEGDVAPVPEPANVALAIFGCVIVGVKLGRWIQKKNVGSL